MQNPYYGKHFFEFIATLLSRIGAFLVGRGEGLFSDELQILVLSAIAVSCGIVGTFLVLRKMTMLANALSHTVLLGIVVAYIFMVRMSAQQGEILHALNLMHLFIAALIMGLITTFLTQFITKRARLQEDASIGLVFTTLFALGIVLVTLFTRNAHVGTEIITGNVDALHIDDLKNVFWIAILNAATACFFYRGFLLTTFDAGFSKSIGVSSSFYHYLLMMQTAITVLGAFRTVGVFLVLSLLVGPVIIARKMTHDLKKLIILSVCIGIFLSVLSIALTRHIFSAYHLALSTSGLLITLIFLSYLAAIFISRLRLALLHKRKKRYHTLDAV